MIDRREFSGRSVCLDVNRSVAPDSAGFEAVQEGSAVALEARLDGGRAGGAQEMSRLCDT